MTSFVLSLGYVGLFLISYLAATILPLVSEVVVVAMPPLGYDVKLVVLTATAGNFLGSLTNYFIGRKGADFVLYRALKIKPSTLARAQDLYQRWGPVSVFFSWIPVIGDPLTIVAGIFRLRLSTFTFWVILGKFLRYLILLGIASEIASLFP
ncbi:MAG: DedA family protein [Anaerolineales bacterium]|nr:DedA family protein [Anaerolineales bacterium]MCB8953302.1 DedA family protein [Ardenticatenales bacterium]